MPPLPLPLVLPPVSLVSLGKGEGVTSPPVPPPFSVPPSFSHPKNPQVSLGDGDGDVGVSLGVALGDEDGVSLGVMLGVGVGDGAPTASWTSPIVSASGKPRSGLPFSAAFMYSVHTWVGVSPPWMDSSPAVPFMESSLALLGSSRNIATEVDSCWV
jgi:hypothetical protein